MSDYKNGKEMLQTDCRPFRAEIALPRYSAWGEELWDIAMLFEKYKRRLLIKYTHSHFSVLSADTINERTS